MILGSHSFVESHCQRLKQKIGFKRKSGPTALYSWTMGGRLPECLATLFIVNGSAWRVVTLIGAEERLR